MFVRLALKVVVQNGRGLCGCNPAILLPSVHSGTIKITCMVRGNYESRIFRQTDARKI